MSGSDEYAGALPRGFTFAGVHCGLKRSGKLDLTLVASSEPVTAAGVYTQNLVCAAPVVIDRARTPTDDLRAVVINSGNANACTGDQGMADAEEMLSLTAQAVDCDPREVLVMSTGVIGVPLEMPKIREGIIRAANELEQTPAAFERAAQGILTTDLCVKTASQLVEVGGQGRRRILAMGKGSGMIAPNMATMLGLVLTDAELSASDSQGILRRVSERTFNRITVDGHTSTNDTVLMLAHRPSGAVSRQALEQIEQAVFLVCDELACKIVDDGEGATHRMEIQVEGCATDEDAVRIATAVANSPLVKTAVAGGDPNWGRIVSAAGYAGPRLDPDRIQLRVNGFLLFENGMPVRFDEVQVSQAMREARVISIKLSCGAAAGEAMIRAADLTAEYVRINADYRT